MHILSVLSGLVGVLVVVLARREAMAAARHVGGRSVLEYPIGLRLLVIVALVLMAAFAKEALPSFLPGIKTFNAADIIMVSMILLLVLFPIAVGLIYFGTRIFFDSQGIENISLWRSRGVVPWKHIERVVPGYYRWTVVTNGYGSIGFNSLQRGWRDLLIRLQESAKKV